MDAVAPGHLKPRKKPRQARSTTTVEAIFEATIQVLLSDGIHRLTTTRVAERAGVSVGSMYQYFPHKQALLYALNERYLDLLALRMEKTCLENHGRDTASMITALVDTYWEAKTERSDVTRVLYQSAVELDNAALIEAFADRMDAATAAMLESAVDYNRRDSRVVITTLLAVVFGTVRNVFERNLSLDAQKSVRHELISMCLSYLGQLEQHRPAEAVRPERVLKHAV